MPFKIIFLFIGDKSRTNIHGAAPTVHKANQVEFLAIRLDISKINRVTERQCFVSNNPTIRTRACGLLDGNTTDQGIVVEGRRRDFNPCPYNI
eukprot:scaffold2068_cov96-Cylindrotheca_fusiformis.AAC.7